MWNRMFEPRVLTDYGPDGFAAISCLPGGESLEWCFGCGKCVPACPVDMVGDYGPRRFHRKVQTGTDLLSDPDLWRCTTGRNCLRVCPKEVDMMAVMPAVREAALSTAGVPAELQDVFEKTFRYGNAFGHNQRRRAQWAETAGVPVRVRPGSPARWTCFFWWRTIGVSIPEARTRRVLLPGWRRRSASIGRSCAEEKTLGDSQRLAGERGLFDALAEDVTAVL